MFRIKASTHFLGGAVAGYKAYPTITGAIVGGIAGLLPDVDDNRSFIGRFFFFVSWPLRHIIGHRTLFHSWIPVLLLALLTVLWPGGNIACIVHRFFISHSIGYVGRQGADIFSAWNKDRDTHAVFCLCCRGHGCKGDAFCTRVMAYLVRTYINVVLRGVPAKGRSLFCP